ncbi:MAG: chemotaxis protein CheA [Hyphomicrobiales bacterium]|nr:chemotaxis protein CheA [Hyphomicrobiales bacterium]PCH50783.1 MAG: chemotaxis protein CheA [Hyphomicrobiales bacterium]
MELDAIRDTFFAECVDQLAELETGLFTIQGEGPDLDTINSVFRAVHSIKGGAGAFSLNDVVSYAHVFENALDILRVDISQSSEARIELLLRASDVLSDVVAVARDGGDPIDCSQISGELEAEFDLVGHGEEVEVEFKSVGVNIDDIFVEDTVANNKFEIKFAPVHDLYLTGHDPQKIFRELKELGDCEFKPNDQAVKALDKFDFKTNQLAWEIIVETTVTQSEVESVFEWVSDCCTMSVTPVVEDDPFGGDDPFGSDPQDIDPFAVDPFADDAITENTISNLVTSASSAEDNEADLAEPTPELTLVKEVPSKIAEKTKDKKPKETFNAAPAKEKARVSKPIRVDSEKVDRLINLMGEIVISQSMLSLQVHEAGFAQASPTGLALVELQNLTREIQSSVMSIRAQPIKPVFMRMSRVVREVSNATGKKATIVLEGETTEVDTTVIEGLSDPLTHMIRNSVDHGIESPEKRLELGKPEVGEIKLAASHSSGKIVIEVRDDGAGINREKVLEIAIKRGIVQAEANLSDEEIDNLIFAPGFSTAETITDVSGRGVGMDVVRQSIQALGGRVSIVSSPGKGSIFTLSLPLTLAILDGMLVKTAEQMFVVPVSSMIETIKLKDEDVFEIGDRHMVFKLRNQLIPIVDVGHDLGFSEKRTAYDDGTVLIVEAGNGSMSAFIVDTIVGQQQVVIKSMESNYRRIESIAAATILGNGRIALILDVEEIVMRKNREVPSQPVLDQIA